MCECERVQSSSLGQSLHMLNAGDIRGKVGSGTGRANRLAGEKRPDEEKIREIYLVAFARPPRADELKTALDYLAEPRTNAKGQAVDKQRAALENYQDLIWALMNTKEFLFNH